MHICVVWLLHSVAIDTWYGAPDTGIHTWRVASFNSVANTTTTPAALTRWRQCSAISSPLTVSRTLSRKPPPSAALNTLPPTSRDPVASSAPHACSYRRCQQEQHTRNTASSVRHPCYGTRPTITTLPLNFYKQRLAWMFKSMHTCMAQTCMLSLWLINESPSIVAPWCAQPHLCIRR